MSAEAVLQPQDIPTLIMESTERKPERVQLPYIKRTTVLGWVDDTSIQSRTKLQVDCDMQDSVAAFSEALTVHKSQVNVKPGKSFMVSVKANKHHLVHKDDFFVVQGQRVDSQRGYVRYMGGPTIPVADYIRIPRIKAKIKAALKTSGLFHVSVMVAIRAVDSKLYAIIIGGLLVYAPSAWQSYQNMMSPPFSKDILLSPLPWG